MKKIYLYLIAGIIMAIGSSCDDYLTVDHYDIMPGDYMFLNEQTAEEGLIGCYDTFYPNKAANDEIGVYLGMFPFKPLYMYANFLVPEGQAGGRDKSFNTQDWTASSNEFIRTWVGHYSGIVRCNYYLAGLAGMDDVLFERGAEGKKQMEAQARAIRAWNYYHLAINFGRVPMLETGETFVNTPAKSRAETVEETWAFIVDDLDFAAKVLDWTPLNGEYGRITKGFCLGHQAIVNMYQGKYSEAKALFKQIIDSNTYSLLPCYSYLFDYERGWTEEDIFTTVMWSDYGPNMLEGNMPLDDHYLTAIRNTASPEYGGWGSYYISWECYDSFESGDRRRQYSMVALGETNPWTGQTIGASESGSATQVKTSSECLPNIFSLKYWRMDILNSSIQNQPFAVRYLRYAEILLDYAECCFRTNEPAAGWAAVQQVRNRAFGLQEIQNNLAGSDPAYPIPLLGSGDNVTVPDAQTFYTQYAANKGYTSEPWLVAVNMERRHEFTAEYSFCYDLKRSGMIEEFINVEYPKGVGIAPDADGAYDDKRFYRSFDLNMDKINLFPIPYNEIQTNDGISPADQNPGY